MYSQPEIEPGDYYAVELERGAMGFGFSIRGGREFQNTPLFVLAGWRGAAVGAVRARRHGHPAGGNDASMWGALSAPPSHKPLSVRAHTHLGQLARGVWLAIAFHMCAG